MWFEWKDGIPPQSQNILSFSEPLWYSPVVSQQNTSRYLTASQQKCFNWGQWGILKWLNNVQQIIGNLYTHESFLAPVVDLV